MSDVTRILTAIEQGDGQASEKLLPLVYDELRKLAAAKLANEKPGQTLQATALVHEAYIRLVGGCAENLEWNSRGHFFSAAAEAMRRILVERARKKGRLRHGGRRKRMDLEALHVADEPVTDDLLALDEALQSLAQEEPIAAEVVTYSDNVSQGREVFGLGGSGTMRRVRRLDRRVWAGDAGSRWSKRMDDNVGFRSVKYISR